MNHREIEAKFFISDPGKLLLKLNEVSALLTVPRVHEMNYRFDSSDHRLSAAGEVLRLRSDTRIRMTYKGASDPNSAVADREELEVELSDLDTARMILEQLGFQIMVVYEKYRTTWQLEDAEIVFDELPMGNFCEIEAKDSAAIERLTRMLDMDWDKRVTISYLAIFQQLKSKHQLKMDQLTFHDFSQVVIHQNMFSEIGIIPADAG